MNDTGTATSEYDSTTLPGWGERGMIDTERYGGRRAFLRHLLARSKTLIGSYSSSMSVDWKSRERLVFVCKGNICRSPYGAMKARSLGVDAVSYGLEAIEDAAANSDAIRNAAQRQIDLSNHRSHKLRAAEIRANDLVLFFEPQHLIAYRQTCGGHPAAVSLLGLWAEPNRPYISDPYGKSDRYFQECFSFIDSAVQAISGKILRGKKSPP
jgi:protein-tyrosine phosphatase